MAPPIDVVDNPFGCPKRFRKFFFEVVEIQLCDQRLRRDAFESRDVLDECAKWRNRRGDEICDRLAFTRRLDVALAEMQDMTAGLHLTGAPQLLLRYRDVREQIRSRDDAARCDDFGQFEREGIERATQFAFDDEQWYVEAGFGPLQRMRSAAIEILDRDILDDGARVRSVAECCNHFEAVAENLFQLRRERVDTHSFMLTVNRSPLTVHVNR